MNDKKRANDETNGAIDLADVRKLARNASTLKRGASTLKRLLSPFAGKSRRSVPRSSARRTSPTRTKNTPPQLENPYLKWVVVVFFFALLVWWLADGGAQVCADALRRLQTPPAPAPAEPTSPEVLADGLWWEGRGVVERVLPDDTEPPRHQRFFLRDDRGRSLFFAHNIDEAPRVPNLREGDELSFRGEWRDNEMGGAMHWTHRAGKGRRKGGWLERAGIRYE